MGGGGGGRQTSRQTRRLRVTLKISRSYKNKDRSAEWKYGTQGKKGEIKLRLSWCKQYNPTESSWAQLTAHRQLAVTHRRCEVACVHCWLHWRSSVPCNSWWVALHHFHHLGFPVLFSTLPVWVSLWTADNEPGQSLEQTVCRLVFKWLDYRNQGLSNLLVMATVKFGQVGM